MHPPNGYSAKDKKFFVLEDECYLFKDKTDLASKGSFAATSLMLVTSFYATNFPAHEISSLRFYN